ncbi:MAG: hypothetical protein NC400_03315 [Clostridium sp.]|nr:hypothetical protein [Clostridium sp.]
MMYMHYCKRCHRVFMLNGHKMICPKCTEPLAELQISYLDYVEMDMEEREAFKEACSDENQLRRLKTTYRMYKYSKWYKELQAQNEDNLPITTLLAAMTQRPDENNRALPQAQIY